MLALIEMPERRTVAELFSEDAGLLGDGEILSARTFFLGAEFRLFW